jgi:predicted phosphodiesterase
MRIAAIYDVHGNLPALEAVLEDIRRDGVDLVVIGGDVLPGPMPRESLSLLADLDLPARFIRGNGEREVLAHLRGGPASKLPEQALEAVRWVAGELTVEQQRWIAGWPEILDVAVPGSGDVLFCHATPRSDTAIVTRLTAEDRFDRVLEGITAPLVVCGHTHMQFDRIVRGTRVVNAGSVGMPFGEAGAHWLLLEPDVRLRHTSYDLPAAAARIRATSYPQAEEFASRDVLRPRSEGEMLELYRRAERLG